MVKKLKKINLSIVIPSKNEFHVDILGHQIYFVLTGNKQINNFEVIIEQDAKATGYGATIKRAIAKSKYEWILIIDGDFTYAALDIERLVMFHECADMVVSERRGAISASGNLRSFGRFLVKQYAMLRTGCKIHDLNSGFRMFRKSLFERALPYIGDGFSLTTTLTMYSLLNAYRIHYVPVFYYSRIGKSSMKPTEFFNYIMTIERCLRNFKHKTM